MTPERDYDDIDFALCHPEDAPRVTAILLAVCDARREGALCGQAVRGFSRMVRERWPAQSFSQLIELTGAWPWRS
jgi:hypothetical protein